MFSAILRAPEAYGGKSRQCACLGKQSRFCRQPWVSRSGGAVGAAGSRGYIDTSLMVEVRETMAADAGGREVGRRLVEREHL